MRKRRRQTLPALLLGPVDAVRTRLRRRPQERTASLGARLFGPVLVGFMGDERASEDDLRRFFAAAFAVCAVVLALALGGGQASAGADPCDMPGNGNEKKCTPEPSTPPPSTPPPSTPAPPPSTPAPTPSQSPSPSPSPTPTVSPSPLPPDNLPPAPTPTPTPSQSPSPSPTPTPSQSPSPSPSPSELTPSPLPPDNLPPPPTEEPPPPPPTEEPPPPTEEPPPSPDPTPSQSPSEDPDPTDPPPPPPPTEEPPPDDPGPTDAPQPPEEEKDEQAAPPAGPTKPRPPVEDGESAPFSPRLRRPTGGTTSETLHPHAPGTEANGAPAAPGGMVQADEPGGLSWSLGRLLDSAGAAAKRLAFPLTLIVIVVLFLLVQGELDRRDPKLAKAAINSELDQVAFQ